MNYQLLGRPNSVSDLGIISVFFFFDFWDFQVSETPIKHAQNLKLMAEVNSMLGDSPISVNILVLDLHENI